MCRLYAENHPSGNPGISSFTDESKDICETVNSIFDSMWQNQPGYELTVLGQFYHFFGIVFGKHYYLENVQKARKDYKRILQLKQVLEFIEHNYASPLTLQELSASVSMSPKYFCRFFSEMTHQTPMDYLNRQRIEQSCYELSTTDDSITEIAYRNGFNDLSYFIRTFKNIRESLRENIKDLKLLCCKYKGAPKRSFSIHLFSYKPH